MPRIAYIENRRFNGESIVLIEHANTILTEYAGMGMSITLRQLYYQFVARGLLANTDKNYKRLGDVVNNARMAGYIDWDHLVDRTRYLRKLPHFADAPHAIRSVEKWYQVDMWKHQEHRPEVWIEKDALVGVIEPVCEELDVPYLSCRGYTSQSEMWGAAQRLMWYLDVGQKPVIIHLGDHDPSGIDMSRDIFDRLELFTGGGVEVCRIALNMDQVNRYQPPPNPAKVTDSRCRDYMLRYGDESWELDALDPPTMTALIRERVDMLADPDIWTEDLDRMAEDKRSISDISYNYDDIVKWVRARNIDEEG